MTGHTEQHEAGERAALRELIVEVAADLSNENPVWTAGCLADALLKAGVTRTPPKPAPNSERAGGSEPRVDRWRKASVALGAWMSAALDDPAVCDAMKADIREWFSAGEPFEGMAQPAGGWQQEQVEAVAQAISHHTYALLSPSDAGDCAEWQDMSETARNVYTSAARAALAALTQPSSERS